MKFFISCDADWDSGIDMLLNVLSKERIQPYFEKRGYGASVNELAVILVARNGELEFKQRIRFSKKDQILYADIMFDLDVMRGMSREDRPKFLAQKLVTEIPPIIAKYKFPDFDLAKFENDFKGFFKKLGWL